MFSDRVRSYMTWGTILGLIGVSEAGDHNNYWLGIPSALMLCSGVGAFMWETWHDTKIKNEAFHRFGDDTEGLNKWLESHGFDRLDEDDEEEEIPDLEDANTPWVLDVANGKVYDKDHHVVLTYAEVLGTNYYKDVWVPNMKHIINYVNENNW